MVTCVESRLLVGDLIVRCMDVGLSRSELMQIVTGSPGDVSSLLIDVERSEHLEKRVRYLHEVIRIAHSICGAETQPWLRTVNPALGGRSPLETMLRYPHALPGMMHLMRRMDEDVGGTVH